jgi:alpha-ketoglutarate-dependent taurine dioxygenase
MKNEIIFPEWGNVLHVDSLEEILSLSDEYLVNLVVNRNLIVIKGCNSELSDHDLAALTEKFGKVWTQAEYTKPYIGSGRDLTVNVETNVSYFNSNRTRFNSKHMAWHADMPHVKDYSYPGRLLYMSQNTTDNSGITSWLNLELAWSQLSQTEQEHYLQYEIVFQDMYRPDTRLETLPFLKVNPKTKKVSPNLNCYCSAEVSIAWIRYVKHNNVLLDYDQMNNFMCEAYDLLTKQHNAVYEHVWSEGDIIVYDNWFNVHQRTAVNEVATANGFRLLKRLTFSFV